MGEDDIEELLEVRPEELTEVLQLEPECVAEEEEGKGKLQGKRKNPQENSQWRV